MHVSSFSFILSLFTLCAALSEPIKLGYVTDLSGKGAVLGTKSQIGVALAQEDLAKKGISVEVKFGDHKTDPKLGVTEVLKLIESEKVQGILCDLTQSCIPASEVALRKNTLFFYQSPAASILEKNPYSFRNFLDYKEGCQAIAQEWKKKNIKRVAGIFLFGEFSELCKQGLLNIYPNALVNDIADEDDSNSIRSLLLRLKSKDIEASILTGFEKQFLTVFRIRRELKLRIDFGVSGALLTSLVKSEIKNDPQFLDYFDFPELDPSFVKRVLERVSDGSNSNIESSAIAYTAVMQEVHALQLCKREDLKCQILKVQEIKDSPLPIESWQDRKAVYMQRVRRWG